MGKAKVRTLKSKNFHVDRNGSSPGLNDEEGEDEDETPSEIAVLENQVAGHMTDARSLGMFKQNGTVLKPITKLTNGKREIDFYESLPDKHPELKEFVPEYFGTKSIEVSGKNVDCIVLEDLTRGFKELCIMDVKIGRRTWDPTATDDKIKSEEKKYEDTKRDVGISLCGFLVHKIGSGKPQRYDKDYGKQLNKDTIQDAFKLFLNGENGFCRDLLLQLLVPLWRILHWARSQQKIRLFSTSILLIYDARKLRQLLKLNIKAAPPPIRATHLYKPLSIMQLNGDHICTGFSGQCTQDGPILTQTSKLCNFINDLDTTIKSHKPSCRLRRVHSFQHNFDEDLQKLRRDYVHILDDLVAERDSDVWGVVKMIDFAHVFPAESHEVDRNYLEGLENLIKILERFLTES